MNRIQQLLILVAATTTLTGISAARGRGANAADDAYAPLRLYDGQWDVAPAAGGQKSTRIENHCAKTGLFFVCEQTINGKVGGLSVFLPVAKLPTGGEEYRTQALRPNARTPGDWGKLTIVGNRWVYPWEGTQNGKKVYGRNVNVFSGTDKIHFELQGSDDGKTWKVEKSGDEQRVR